MVDLSRVKEGDAEKIKIDKLDRKIIRKLFSRKRQSINSIAKGVKASKEVTNYRIKRLQDSGIVQGIVALIDTFSQGYMRSIHYLKLQKITGDRENEIIDFFVKNGFTNAVATCTGTWDLFVVFDSRDIIQYDDFIIDFENFCGENLKKRKSSIIVEEYFMPYDYISQGAEIEVKKGNSRRKIKVDDIDKKIMKYLSVDSSTRLVDLAKKTKITPEAISYRIKKLTEEKIITGFFPLVNISKLGYHWYTVALYLHHVNKEREGYLIKYLKSHPNIVVVIKTVGDWSIEFDIHIESSRKFREILMDIREKFSDIINDYESNLIFNDYKYTHFPDGLMK